MTVGRKPKPTHMKILEGTARRDRMLANEPRPKVKKPTAPKHLDDEGKREWRRVVRLLFDLNMMTDADRSTLTGYCETWSRFVSAQKHLRTPGSELVYEKANGDLAKSPWVTVLETCNKDLRAYASEFGLSPSARSRISVEPKTEADPYEEFVKRGKSATG